MKMFYLAFTNKGNVGDLLITKFQIDEYAKYGEVYVDCHGMPDDFHKVIFETGSPNIKDFEAEFGCTYRSKKILKVISILNKQHFTHFCSSPGPRETLSFPLKKLVFKLMGAILPAIFMSRHIKKYSLGVDVNYTSRSFFGWLNTLYFARLDIIGIRSETNLERVKNHLHNVVYVPDMAFLYPMFDEASYVKIKKRIAMSFRNIDDIGQLLSVLKSIGMLASKGNFEIDVIYQVDEDKVLCEQLTKEINKLNVRFIESPVDYFSLDRYKNYDIVVSNRLHVLLMAAMNGAYPFALISDSPNEHKIQDILGSVFGNNHVVHINKYQEDQFDRVMNDINGLKNDVCKKVKEQRTLCTQIIRELVNNEICINKL